MPEINFSLFESIKHRDGNGIEYWDSRELAQALDYKYQNFENVLEKSKEACRNSHQNIDYHFIDSSKMIATGKGAHREVKSTLLSRYACYLIVQNADPSKEVVALGQTYFAVQTRIQEIENERRLLLREDMRRHNKDLAAAARDAGVIQPMDYAIFQNAGYKGLYNGETASMIKRRKGLKKSQDILDHMGSEELADNMFRVTQAEARLRREQITDKNQANAVHYDTGRRVRGFIKELGGTMPEDLPTPGKSIKELEAEQKKQLKGSASQSDEQ